MKVIRIHPMDNVVVAVGAITAGETVMIPGSGELTVRGDIPKWHKIAIAPVAAGGRVLKYGEVIGVASIAIVPGEHVHSHNLKPEEE